MKWLEILGTTQTNWKNQTVEFDLGCKRVKLLGEPILGRSLVSLKVLEWEIRCEKEGILVELSNTELGESQMPTILNFLIKVLTRFRELFNESSAYLLRDFWSIKLF